MTDSAPGLKTRHLSRPRRGIIFLKMISRKDSSIARHRRTLKDTKSNSAIVGMLMEKASHSACTYKVSAVAFDKKGDVLGHATNSHSDWNVVAKTGGGRAGTAKHAERRLLSQFGRNARTIVICRVGHSGDLRPIDPCPACRKVADKLGVKIVTIG